MLVCLFVCLLDSNGKNGKRPPWRKELIAQVYFVLHKFNFLVVVDSR